MLERDWNLTETAKLQFVHGIEIPSKVRITNVNRDVESAAKVGDPLTHTGQKVKEFNLTNFWLASHAATNPAEFPCNIHVS